MFWDGSNRLHALKQMGWSIDAEKMLSCYRGYGDLVSVNYYTGRNHDVKLIQDMFKMIHYYDMAILISCDSDLEEAVQLLQSFEKEVRIISTDPLDVCKRFLEIVYS